MVATQIELTLHESTFRRLVTTKLGILRLLESRDVSVLYRLSPLMLAGVKARTCGACVFVITLFVCVCVYNRGGCIFQMPASWTPYLRVTLGRMAARIASKSSFEYVHLVPFLHLAGEDSKDFPIPRTACVPRSPSF